jgi:hypothetical protein
MDATYDLTLRAEIVGVMEGAEQHSAKVLVKPVYLTIPADLSMHLGDIIQISARLSVTSIRMDIDNEADSGPLSHDERVV